MSTAGEAVAYRAALREIIAVLGPEPPSGLSSGAAWEWAKALQVAKAAYAAPSASSSAEADDDQFGPVTDAELEAAREPVRIPAALKPSAEAGAVDERMIERAARALAALRGEDFDYISKFMRAKFLDGAESILTAALTTQREDRDEVKPEYQCN